MRRLDIVVAIAVGAALWTHAAPSQACSPADPAIDFTIPTDGGLHPANAEVLVFGYVLDPTDLEATVDGIPVVVEVGPRSNAVNFWGWDPAVAYAELMLSVSPPPLPGQQVHIFGDLCTPEAEMVWPNGCLDLDLTYEAGPEDLEGAELDLDLWYDVYDHESEATAGSLCSTGPTARFSIDIWLDFVEEEAEVPTYFSVHLRPRNEPGAWTQVGERWRLQSDHAIPSFHLLYVLDEVIDLLPLAEAFCFEVRTEDLAGNPGPSLERCPPCHDQVGEQGSSFIGEFPEAPPLYTDEFIVPDGYCPQSVLEGDESGGTSTGEPPAADESGGGSSGEPPPQPGTASGGSTTDGDAAEADGAVDRGCACTSAPAPGPRRNWALLLLPLALGAIRRRAPRARGGC